MVADARASPTRPRRRTIRRAFSRKAAIPHDRRSTCRMQDNPAGRIRVATPHGLPVLVCTRVHGQLQKLVHVSAHLTVVPNDQRLHRPERIHSICINRRVSSLRDIFVNENSEYAKSHPRHTYYKQSVSQSVVYYTPISI